MFWSVDAPEDTAHALHSLRCCNRICMGKAVQNSCYWFLSESRRPLTFVKVVTFFMLQVRATIRNDFRMYQQMEIVTSIAGSMVLAGNCILSSSWALGVYCHLVCSTLQETDAWSSNWSSFVRYFHGRQHCLALSPLFDPMSMFRKTGSKRWYIGVKSGISISSRLLNTDVSYLCHFTIYQLEDRAGVQVIDMAYPRLWFRAERHMISLIFL